MRRSLVTRRVGLALFGPTLGDALSRSIDPFVKGLSGRPEAVRAFLERLGLDPKHETAALDADGERRLHQALLQKLVQQGVRAEFCESLKRERYHLPSLGVDAEELSNWQNALGRASTPDLGVTLALGDPVPGRPAGRRNRRGAPPSSRDSGASRTVGLTPSPPSSGSRARTRRTRGRRRVSR